MMKFTKFLLLGLLIGLFAGISVPSNFGNDNALSASSSSLFVEAAAADEAASSSEEFQIPTFKAGAEVNEFQAEVSRLMDIIINSLYSNKDIFLRELISNGSDALDKIRYFALTQSDKFGSTDDLDLKMRVVPDKEAKTLTIIDTGIGMTKDQLISELGTVAKSGTSSFIEAFEQNADVNLIGQFGVGFYSVYLVADTVTVTSKSPESDDTYVWESSADQTFTISSSPVKLERGTQITLHLKEEAEEYLEEGKLTDILKKHSLFINYPIFLEKTKEIEEEITEQEEEGEEDDAEKAEGDDDGMEVDDEDEEGEEDEDADVAPKTRKVEIKEDERINESKPLWLRSAEEIEDEEYNDFYKVLKGATGDSLAHIH